MKLNNKGFAITSIIYGILILFSLIMIALLGILVSRNTRTEKLAESIFPKMENYNYSLNEKLMSDNDTYVIPYTGKYTFKINDYDDGYCYIYLFKGATVIYSDLKTNSCINNKLGEKGASLSQITIINGESSIGNNIDKSNANHPVLEKKMIPIFYNNDKWRVSHYGNTDINNAWYDYREKKWANAVIVDNNSSPVDLVSGNKGEYNGTNRSLNDDYLKLNDSNLNTTISYIKTGYTLDDSKYLHINNKGVVFYIKFRYNGDIDDNYNEYIFGNTPYACYNSCSTNSSSQFPGIFLRVSGKTGVYASNKEAYNYAGGYLDFNVWGKSIFSSNKLEKGKTYIVYAMYSGGEDTLNPLLYVNDTWQESDSIVGETSCSVSNCTNNNEYTLGAAVPTLNQKASIDIFEFSIFDGGEDIERNYYGNNIKDILFKDPLFSYNFSNTYRIDFAINEKAFDSIYVWIPRFKYKLWNANFDNGSILNKNIDIIFEKGIQTTGKGTTNENYITHPAFENDKKGFWIGKFETNNEGKAIPNVNTNLLLNSYTTIVNNININNNHTIITNQQWGAVSYLAYSKFGVGNVGIGKNSSYYSGGGENDEYKSTQNTSTTGNIYGVYDMNGGASDIVLEAGNTFNRELGNGIGEIGNNINYSSSGNDYITRGGHNTTNNSNIFSYELYNKNNTERIFTTRIVINQQ